MKAWSELWHQFVVTLTQQPPLAVLTVSLGLALMLLFALEGLLFNLFPVVARRRFPNKPAEEKSAPAPVLGLRDVPEKMPEPPMETVADPLAPAALPPAAKIRPARNRKKPAPKPKPARVNASWRRTAPSRERLSRSTPRLLAPKN
jgi:hypothetical protein